MRLQISTLGLMVCALVSTAPAQAQSGMLDVDSLGPWTAQAGKGADLRTKLTLPDRLGDHLEKLFILTYKGALIGQASGATVDGANVPFVNGQANVQINLFKSTVVGKFTADIFRAHFNDFLLGWLNAKGNGIISLQTHSYVFNSFTGTLNSQAIGSQYPFGGPFFNTVTGSGTINGPLAHTTTGQLSGHDFNPTAGNTFTASFTAKR